MSVTRVREREREREREAGGGGCLLLNCLLLCDEPRAYTTKMSTLKIIKKKRHLPA